MCLNRAPAAHASLQHGSIATWTKHANTSGCAYASQKVYGSHEVCLFVLTQSYKLEATAVAIYVPLIRKLLLAT